MVVKCAIDFLYISSEDNRVLLWDVRSAKSYLMSLDQHNGEAKSDTKKGLHHSNKHQFYFSVSLHIILQQLTKKNAYP